MTDGMTDGKTDEIAIARNKSVARQAEGSASVSGSERESRSGRMRTQTVAAAVDGHSNGSAQPDRPYQARAQHC